VQSPHDQLFHYTFGQPENAADLLRSTLPTAISAAIDWHTLTRCDSKLTDARSESLYADVLFTVSVQSRTAYLLLLLEHKSEEDRKTALQLLRYVLRIWDRHEADHPESATLPPILAVVLHHGRTPWRGARSLRELIDLAALPASMADAVRARQPDLTFHLDDLAAQSEAQIVSRVSSLLGQMALLCMQFLRGAGEAEAETALRRWLSLLRRLHAAADAREAFVRLVEYIATVADLHKDRVLRILAEVHPDAEQITMKTYGRMEREALERETRGRAEGKAEGRAEGKAEGRAEGKAEGRAEGKAEILLRQLEARFGRLAPDAVNRVLTAAPPDLDRWAVQVLDARTIEEVLSSR